MDEEFDLPQRIVVNWKKIGFYALPAALAAGLLVARIGMQKGRAERDYVSAKAAFTQWEQGLDQTGDDFTKLEKVVKKHPELRPHYDASIAQALLAAPSPQEAAPFIERTLQRTRQPYYSDYARTTLKISEKKYQEALDESLNLKDQLLSDHSFWKNSKNSSALFAFNLMRIAVLSQQLNHQDTELEAWKELQYYQRKDKSVHHIGHEGFKALFSHFSIQETTLVNYIEAREAKLRSP